MTSELGRFKNHPQIVYKHLTCTQEAISAVKYHRQENTVSSTSSATCLNYDVTVTAYYIPEHVTAFMARGIAQETDM